MYQQDGEVDLKLLAKGLAPADEVAEVLYTSKYQNESKSNREKNEQDESTEF